MDIRFDDFRIGVLGGGVSCERDISLISAGHAFDILKRHNLDVVLIDISSRDKTYVAQEMMSKSIDVAFIALHGEFGEDGGIQQILEELGITYTGSGPEASYLAMDKIASKEVFQRQHIPTALFKVLEKGRPFPACEDYPVVVKPASAGSSLGVSIAKDPSMLPQAIEEAFLLQNKIILEDYIEGREFTVGILDERALAVVEIISKHEYFDFQTKYSDGYATFEAPAKLEPALYQKLQEIALSAHRALGCRHFSRVDIRVNKKNDPFVLEVNSIPGLTSHSLLPLSAHCCGITFDGLILKMLLLAYHEKKRIQKV